MSTGKTRNVFWANLLTGQLTRTKDLKVEDQLLSVHPPCIS